MISASGYVIFSTVQDMRFDPNYRQSVTLTSTYSGGLKQEVEKAELPVATRKSLQR